MEPWICAVDEEIAAIVEAHDGIGVLPAGNRRIDANRLEAIVDVVCDQSRTGVIFDVLTSLDSYSRKESQGGGSEIVTIDSTDIPGEMSEVVSGLANRNGANFDRFISILIVGCASMFSGVLFVALGHDASYAAIATVSSPVSRFTTSCINVALGPDPLPF